MKTLHLIRHAKSSWVSTHLNDQQRPLSPRGTKDCQIMATALHAAGMQFSNVYCSVAQRAQLTIQGLAQHWPGRSFDWKVTEALYTFSHSQVWQLIQGFDDAIQQVVLVGHNPAFTDFINTASNATLVNLPTCAYAKLNFPVSLWQSAMPQLAELAAFMKPKMFK